MIMVTIAVERYLSICKPLVTALTPVRAWLVTAVLGIFAAAIGVCVALMYSVRHYITLDDDRKQFTSCQSTSSNISMTTGAGRSPLTSDDDTVATSDCLTTPQPITIEVHRGICYPTDDVFSANFIWYFQKVYNGLYLVCFVAVVVLYILIYRSVHERRRRHQRQKNRSMSVILTQSQRHRSSAPCTRSVVTVAETSEAGELQDLATESSRTVATAASTIVTDSRLQAVRKQNRVANLKTAAMLFVVTVVFVVTFLPAFLMTVQMLPYSIIIFYMYFANNVANPIIYSFMNNNFRGHLKQMICRRRHGRRVD